MLVSHYVVLVVAAVVIDDDCLATEHHNMSYYGNHIAWDVIAARGGKHGIHIMVYYMVVINASDIHSWIHFMGQANQIILLLM